MSPLLSPSELFLRAQTDERLAALAADGHGRAFAILVERHRRRLHAHARRIVGRERGEDVVQQALLRAWLSLSRGDEVHHVAAWLHRIVHNVALTELTRSLAASEPLDEEFRDPASIEHTTERRLEVRALLAGLAGLPERQRLALLGTEIEGRSRRQLAAELGLTEGAVRQLVHRARAGVRASVAALVPWPLVMRGMRASGWLDAGDARWHPGGDAGASSPLAGGAVAGGALAGGAVKAGTALLIVGTIGSGIALRDGRERAHRHRAVGPGARTSTVARTRLPGPLSAWAAGTASGSGEPSVGAATGPDPTRVLGSSGRVSPAGLQGERVVAAAAAVRRPSSFGGPTGERSRGPDDPLRGASGGTGRATGSGGDSGGGSRAVDGGGWTEPSDGSTAAEGRSGTPSPSSVGEGGASGGSDATAPAATATAASADGEQPPAPTVSPTSGGSGMATDTADPRETSSG